MNRVEKTNKVDLMGAMLVFFIVLKYYGNITFSELLIPVSKISMILSGILAAVLIGINIKKYNIYHLAMFLLLCIQFIFTKSILLIYPYILALALLNLDMKSIIKTYIVSSLILFIISLVLNIVNINPTTYVSGRNDLGFGNPNGAYISFFVIYISYMYLKFDNLGKEDILLLIIFPLMVYVETETRTGFLTIAGAFVLTFILKKIDIRQKYIKTTFALTPIIISVISVIIAYTCHYGVILNRFLSHRPQYWYKYLSHQQYGLNFIGYNDNIRDIVFTPRLPLDSGYIFTLYASGIIVFTILILLYSYAIYQLCNENKKAEVMLVLSILVYAFAESMLLDLGTNISFVFIAYAISKLYQEKSLIKLKK